jgi:hypothetical protein
MSLCMCPACQRKEGSVPPGYRYGLAEGKVKIGQLRSNKPASLYATGFYVCAVASSTSGHGICSSHMDGSIHKFLFHQVRVLRR